MDSNRSIPLSALMKRNESLEALSKGVVIDQEEDIELTDMSALKAHVAMALSDPTVAIIQPSSTIVVSAQPSPMHHRLRNQHQSHIHHQHVHSSPLMVHRQNGSIAIELVQQPSDMQDSEMMEYDAAFKFLTTPNMKPSKSEVLHYFVQADTFFINRINHDMQITDEDGYPLFDAYVDVDFVNRIWRLEVYGRLVLSMYEPLSLCSELARMRIPMTDWNGDFFGAIVPGDPFLILSSERQVVAKLILHRTPIVDNEEQQHSPSSAQQAPSAGIPTKPCWLCVLEGSGRHVARLEDYQFIQFYKDVGFQLKLLTLAALVRLVGQLNPVNNFASVIKYTINCCANGY